MSSDIEKMAVFDARIVQQRPKYAVEKGALSLTNSPFNAIAATTTQHTYNIYVPSENVFVDRGVDWTSTVYMSATVTTPNAQTDAGDLLLAPGRDFALTAFPLNSLCSTVTATINDTTTVINTQDVLREVLRLADYSDNRKQRLCPTMLDTYASYADGTVTAALGGQGSISTPIAGWNDTRGVDYVPNGAFPQLIFTLPSGTPAANQTALAGNNEGLPYDFANGLPIAPPGNIAALTPLTFYIAWKSTEKIVLSPFTFADVHEWDTGLFGINNIQLIMNLLSSPARVLRFNGVNTSAVGAVTYNSSATGGAFQSSRVNVQFLTPSLDVPLPPKSVVPYMEFPRYISQPGTPIPAGGTAQLVSQTITLPQIPDLFIIYAKAPPQSLLATDADYYLPPATAFDSVPTPLSVNFDNFSGLLSSHTAEQLYQMSVKNGLEMDWSQWVGYAHMGLGAGGAPPPAPAAGSSLGVPGGCAAMTGGFLVLKPSQDITLQTGQAPSLVGNFTFQFNLTVRNNTGVQVTPQLYVITANSGFFESIRGSSRIIKGVLSEQDIISAPLAPMGTRSALHRWVGAGMKGMATILGKTPSLAGSATGAAVGAASTGGVGAGMAGASVGAGGRVRKGMSARLM